MHDEEKTICQKHTQFRILTADDHGLEWKQTNYFDLKKKWNWIEEPRNSPKFQRGNIMFYKTKYINNMENWHFKMSLGWKKKNWQEPAIYMHICRRSTKWVIRPWYWPHFVNIFVVGSHSTCTCRLYFVQLTNTVYTCIVYVWTNQVWIYTSHPS